VTKVIKINTGRHPKLSIVIPTRNRKMQINLLIRSLHELLIEHHKEIEIIISDNSDDPINFQDLPPYVRIIRPDSFLPTAEENLFFALEKCRGDFVWPVGDDDIPQREGVQALFDYLKNPVGDWAVFNFGIIDFTGVLKSLKSISSSKPKVKFFYSDFVSIVGYQTTAACISLTIFRRSLVTSKLVSEVRKFTSPIYSHVALYLLSFGNSRGLYIDTPLIYYRNNRQATSPRDDTWVKWSKRNRAPYRYPWTIGLIEQFNYLIQSGALNEDFPTVFLETDHFGNKFSGLMQMLQYIIDQIRLDEKIRTNLKFSLNDRLIIIEFLLKYAPQHTYLIEALQKLKSGKKRFFAPRYVKYNYLTKSYRAVVERFTFAHALVKIGHRGIFYQVPMGYLYLPHGDSDYLGYLKVIDFFQNKTPNFHKDLDLLTNNLQLMKNTKQIKPLEIHTFSNFAPHDIKEPRRPLFPIRILKNRLH